MKFNDTRSFRDFLMAKELEAQLSRPPLGLKPWWLAAEQRITEIESAALRYTLAQQDVPRSWLRERRLLKWALKLGRAPKGRFPGPWRRG